MSQNQPETHQVFEARSIATSASSAADALEIIREEQNNIPTAASSEPLVANGKISDDSKRELMKCICKKYDDAIKQQKQRADDLEKLLHEKEATLRAEYDKILEREMASMKQRFDFILANEQTRASHLLREAHRERQEKITVLQSQLECKNLAALMYVMCTEKRRSKLEKLRLIRDYTDYIHLLQEILTEGQELILYLSRGYKTAARVDYEWREKMKKVIKEFLSFIYHFTGGSPETNQYMIDLPKLLKIETPLEINPQEDPCDDEEEEEAEYYEPVQDKPPEKKWYEQLDDDHRPFVLFGDMADFTPKHRREVIKTVKAAKTAPRKWKNYVFNDMILNSTCSNISKIKDMYVNNMPSPAKWDCENNISEFGGTADLKLLHAKNVSKQSLSASYRAVCQSVDIRGNMGSLLRIITSANTAPVPAKTEILGARDSMEIAPTTKLRERAQSMRPEEAEGESEPPPILAIGKKRASIFDGYTDILDTEALIPKMPFSQEAEPPKSDPELEKAIEDNLSILGSIHNDSLQVINSHIPDVDHTINYEKVCPMEKCKRLQVDSFMRSLPPYMRANPYTHFEQTFEHYETCTPEQLEILNQRIEAKKMKEAEEIAAGAESPLREWIGRGVAVQTSDIALSDLPPCTCHVPSTTPDSSNFVFDFQDLLPVKEAMDAIHKELMFDNRVEFNRFKLLGQDSAERLNQEEPKKEFQQVRQDEIRKILNQHPSLLDLFQANTR